MRFTRKIKMGMLAALLVISAAPLNALAYYEADFHNFEATTYNDFTKNVFSQLNNQYQDLNKAFNDLGKTLSGMFKEYSTIGSTINSNVSQLINNLPKDVAPAPLVNAYKDTAVKIDSSYGQQDGGKIYTDDTTTDIKSLGAVHNPTEAVVLKTILELRNRSKDSMNVVSYLDQNAKDYKCLSSAQCTTLVALAEQTLTQVNSTQDEVVARGKFWLNLKVKPQGDDVSYQSIYTVGIKALTSGSDVDHQKNNDALATFVTPAPMITAGFNPNYSTSTNDTTGTLAPVRAAILSDVLLGSNDYSALKDYQTSPGANLAALQTKIITRFARAQLARQAIQAVTNKELITAMTSEFKACVARPAALDSVGSTVQQHLTNIEQLMRCNNLSLLHLRRVQMEQSRLIAVLLATQLDSFGFATAEELKAGQAN